VQSLSLIEHLCVSYLPDIVDAMLTITPNRAHELSGSSVSFDCSIKKPLTATAVCWKYSPDNNIENISIYDGKKMNAALGGRVSVTNVSSSISRLTINSAQINDTGYYICFNCSGPSESASSQLDVFRELVFHWCSDAAIHLLT